MITESINNIKSFNFPFILQHPLDYFCGKRTEGVTFSITAEDQEELKEQEIQKSERMLKYYKGKLKFLILFILSAFRTNIISVM